MTRVSDLNDTEVFRVITTTTYESGYVATQVLGPYRTLGAAKGMLTRELGQHDRYQYSRGMAIIGHVERSSISWEPVS